jgi:hypothetical protein
MGPNERSQKYQKLVDELKELYDLAEADEFSDFANQQFATPKVELATRLYNIRQNVIDGQYDD